MFEETLFEELRGLRARRSGVALVLAIAAHLGVLVVVTAVRLWSIEELPEPPVMVSFWAAPPAPPPPPPPPPPPRGQRTAERTEAPVDPNPKQETQPVVVPPQTPQSAAPAVGSEDGVEGGVEGGVPGGVIGGIVGGLPAAAPPAPPAPVTLRVGGDVKEPRKIKHVEPVYPDLAAKARLEGVIILEAIIAPNGQVRDVKVLRGMPLLDEAALAAVRQWAYTPTLLSGVPVQVALVVTVRFRITQPMSG
jgi:protein TonB